MSKINVTVWNEFVHEKIPGEVKNIYPDGIHMAIASYLEKNPNLEITTATLDQKDHGLTEIVFNYIIYW